MTTQQPEAPVAQVKKQGTILQVSTFDDDNPTLKKKFTLGPDDSSNLNSSIEKGNMNVHINEENVESRLDLGLQINLETEQANKEASLEMKAEPEDGTNEDANGKIQEN